MKPVQKHKPLALSTRKRSAAVFLLPCSSLQSVWSSPCCVGGFLIVANTDAGSSHGRELAFWKIENKPSDNPSDNPGDVARVVFLDVPPTNFPLCATSPSVQDGVQAGLRATKLECSIVLAPHHTGHDSRKRHVCGLFFLCLS